MSQDFGLWIANQEVATPTTYPVYHKYTGAILAQVAEATENEAHRAVSESTAVLSTPLSVPQRVEILHRAADLLHQRKDEFALRMAQEAGKPLKDGRAEVDRGIQTLRYSAVAALMLRGHEVPVRGNPGSEHRIAWTIRKPYGVVLAITPFNFPLNLVLHKVGPALAAGNSVVLKPAPQTPLTALALGRLLQDAGLPPGWVNIVTGSATHLGEWLVADPGVRVISFTGSATVGKKISAAAGIRPVILELGNNSANIVHDDARLDEAAEALARRAFGFAGQACIAVQRILVQKTVVAEFTQRFQEAARHLVVGNPEEPTTDVGPMINEEAADRIEQWYGEAVSQGARPLQPWSRQGALVSPMMLEGVTPAMQVWSEEVFAPIAGLTAYDTFDQALAWTNTSRYGLQAGVFTAQWELALRAAQVLDVGGVVINDSSSYRADNMPYGGVKESGLGREGPEYAVEQMTYPTVVVFNARS